MDGWGERLKTPLFQQVNLVYCSLEMLKAKLSNTSVD